MSLTEKLQNSILFLFILLLPTQFGKHFFFDFSYIGAIRVDYLALKLYTTDILALILILIHNKLLQGWIRKYRQFLVIFLGLACVNIATSTHPIISLFTLVKYLEVIFIGVIFYKQPIAIKTIVVAFTFGALFELSLSISQMVTHGSLQGIFYYFGERFLSTSMPGIAKTTLRGVELLRPYGTFSHPNSLGGFYVLIYTWTLFQLHTVSSKSHSVYIYLLLFFSSLLVFFSFSKNAVLGYSIISIIYIYLYAKMSCTMCKIGRLVGIVALGGLFLSSTHATSSISERYLFFKQGAILFLEKPLFGQGIGQHLYALSRFPSQNPYFFNQPIHNIFLLALVEWGILLFGFVTWTIGQVLKGREVPVLFIVSVVVFTGLFDHYWLTLQQNMLLIGVLFGTVFNKTNPPARNEPVSK